MSLIQPDHKVVVYLLASDANSPRTSKINSLFSSPIFAVNVMVISPPSNLLQSLRSSNQNDIDDLVESYRIQWCLNDAKTRHPKNHIIILKDTSVSNASPDRIAKVISAAINNGLPNSHRGSHDSWHVCYLSKWLDRCDLYTDRKPVNGTMTEIVKTSAAHGDQALLFSPHGRDVFTGTKQMKNGSTFSSQGRSFGSALHDAVMNGNVDAIATQPNLLVYDISAAKNHFDLLKTHECDAPTIASAGANNRPIVRKVNPSSDVPTTGDAAVDAAADVAAIGGKQLQQTVNNNASLWILLLIIVLILIFFWFLWKQRF